VEGRHRDILRSRPRANTARFRNVTGMSDRSQRRSGYVIQSRLATLSAQVKARTAKRAAHLEAPAARIHHTVVMPPRWGAVAEPARDDRPTCGSSPLA
jgi:hypothetical protein